MSQQNIDHADAYAALQRWVASNEALSVLREVARGVLKWAKNDPLLHEILSVKQDENDKELGIISFVLDVMFDTEKLENCRLNLHRDLINGNMNNIRLTLISRIINYCKDERRKEENSPFHACYRRVRDAISESKGKLRCVPRKHGESVGYYYATAGLLDLPFLFEGYLSAEGYRGWPHPGFDSAEINKARVLMEISLRYWDVALKIIEKQHFLPILDLVRYIFPLLH